MAKEENSARCTQEVVYPFITRKIKRKTSFFLRWIPTKKLPAQTTGHYPIMPVLTLTVSFITFSPISVSKPVHGLFFTILP